MYEVLIFFYYITNDSIVHKILWFSGSNSWQNEKMYNKIWIIKLTKNSLKSNWVCENGPETRDYAISMRGKNFLLHRTHRKVAFLHFYAHSHPYQLWAPDIFASAAAAAIYWSGDAFCILVVICKHSGVFIWCEFLAKWKPENERGSERASGWEDWNETASQKNWTFMDYAQKLRIVRAWGCYR